MNIKFTSEKETNHTLPFLDINIESMGNKFKTSIFKKASDTGLLTNFKSFIHSKYKKSLVKTLIDRIYKINSSWKGFHQNITKMREILQKNNFPDKFIYQNIREEVRKKIEKRAQKEQNNKEKAHYFSLPYIGTFSKTTEQKLNSIIQKYCKTGTKIKVAFTSTKISSFFSPKDEVSKEHASKVVYKFSCNGCQSIYVGFTTCHLTKRIHEHFNTDSNSHIFQHLKKSKKCKKNLSSNSFEILDHGKTTFELKQKEAMWIKWLAPDLNKQKKYQLNLSIMI